MTQVNVININSPFLDQKPGTSGLRKSTLKFQEEHYLEIFIEAILHSLEDLQGSTLVVEPCKSSNDCKIASIKISR